MNIKTIILGILILCLSSGMFVNTIKASDAESNTFSCLGAWADEDENNTFVLDEGGTGSLVQKGTVTNNDTGETHSSQSTSSIKWEDKGDTVNIVGFFGSYDFMKAKEDDQEVLKTGKVTYHRVESDDTNNVSQDLSMSSLQSIPFDLPLVYEDDILKVELAQFYEDRVKWIGQNEPSIEKYVVFKVTNKNAAGFLFNLSSAYINSDEVNVIMQDGNSGPQTGKSKTFSFNIQYDTKPNSTAINSIDELYDLGGVFRISVKDVDDYIIDQYEVNFSLPSLDLKEDSGK